MNDLEKSRQLASTCEKPRWKVQMKGKFGGNFELSVVREDNEHGQRSWGWGDATKIILFGTGMCMNTIREGQEDFAMDTARKLCDVLNLTYK